MNSGRWKTLLSSTNVHRELFQSYKRYLNFIDPVKWAMWLNVFIITLITLTSVALIWVIGEVIDGINTGIFDNVQNNIIILAIAFIAFQSLRYLNHYLYEWMEQKVIFSIRQKAYEKTFCLYDIHNSKFDAGDIVSRLAQDIIKISELMIVVPGHILQSILTLIFYTSVIFYINVDLAIIALLFIPLFVFHQALFVKKARQTSKCFLSFQGKMSGFESESLTNIKGIATFNSQNQMLDKFNMLFLEFKAAAMKNLLLNNFFVISFELTIGLCGLTLVYLGVNAIQMQNMTVGHVVNFLLYLGYLAHPLRMLARIPIDSQLRISAIERIDELLNIPEIIDPKTSRYLLANIRGHIEISSMSFSYSEQQTIINDMNLEIQPNELIAVVGKSGVGKSTLAKLLLRLLEPDHGHIKIDGVDIRQISLNDLRNIIAVVWQEPFILNDTINNNFLMANPKATQSEIIEASKLANAHEFISEMSDGYETTLRSQGANLSAGQRQRISIAQALLRKSKIIILDEPTSALDALSEKLITNTINILKHTTTTIVIAHRYSTIHGADRIIYINQDGSITTGSHHTLLNTHPGYKSSFEQIFCEST